MTEPVDEGPILSTQEKSGEAVKPKKKKKESNTGKIATTISLYILFVALLGGASVLYVILGTLDYSVHGTIPITEPLATFELDGCYLYFKPGTDPANLKVTVSFDLVQAPTVVESTSSIVISDGRDAATKAAYPLSCFANVEVPKIGNVYQLPSLAISSSQRTSVVFEFKNAEDLVSDVIYIGSAGGGSIIMNGTFADFSFPSMSSVVVNSKLGSLAADVSYSSLYMGGSVDFGSLDIRAHHSAIALMSSAATSVATTYTETSMCIVSASPVALSACTGNNTCSQSFDVFPTNSSGSTTQSISVALSKSAFSFGVPSFSAPSISSEARGGNAAPMFGEDEEAELIETFKGISTGNVTPIDRMEFSILGNERTYDWIWTPSSLYLKLDAAFLTMFSATLLTPRISYKSVLLNPGFCPFPMSQLTLNQRGQLHTYISSIASNAAKDSSVVAYRTNDDPRTLHTEPISYTSVGKVEGSDNYFTVGYEFLQDPLVMFVVFFSAAFSFVIGIAAVAVLTVMVRRHQKNLREELKAERALLDSQMEAEKKKGKGSKQKKKTKEEKIKEKQMELEMMFVGGVFATIEQQINNLQKARKAKAAEDSKKKEEAEEEEDGKPKVKVLVGENWMKGVGLPSRMQQIKMVVTRRMNILIQMLLLFIASAVPGIVVVLLLLAYQYLCKTAASWDPYYFIPYSTELILAIGLGWLFAVPALELVCHITKVRRKWRKYLQYAAYLPIMINYTIIITFVVFVMMWVLLGVIINPEGAIPFAAAIVTLFASVGTTKKKLNGIRTKLVGTVKDLIEQIAPVVKARALEMAQQAGDAVGVKVPVEKFQGGDKKKEEVEESDSDEEGGGNAMALLGKAKNQAAGLIGSIVANAKKTAESRSEAGHHQTAVCTILKVASDGLSGGDADGSTVIKMVKEAAPLAMSAISKGTAGKFLESMLGSAFSAMKRGAEAETSRLMQSAAPLAAEFVKDHLAPSLRAALADHAPGFLNNLLKELIEVARPPALGINNVFYPLLSRYDILLTSDLPNRSVQLFFRSFLKGIMLEKNPQKFLTFITQLYNQFRPGVEPPQRRRMIAAAVVSMIPEGGPRDLLSLLFQRVLLPRQIQNKLILKSVTDISANEIQTLFIPPLPMPDESIEKWMKAMGINFRQGVPGIVEDLQEEAASTGQAPPSRQPSRKYVAIQLEPSADDIPLQPIQPIQPLTSSVTQAPLGIVDPEKLRPFTVVLSPNDGPLVDIRWKAGAPIKDSIYYWEVHLKPESLDTSRVLIGGVANVKFDTQSRAWMFGWDTRQWDYFCGQPGKLDQITKAKEPSGRKWEFAVVVLCTSKKVSVQFKILSDWVPGNFSPEGKDSITLLEYDPDIDGEVPRTVSIVPSVVLMREFHGTCEISAPSTCGRKMKKMIEQGTIQEFSQSKWAVNSEASELARCRDFLEDTIFSLSTEYANMTRREEDEDEERLRVIIRTASKDKQGNNIDPGVLAKFDFFLAGFRQQLTHGKKEGKEDHKEGVFAASWTKCKTAAATMLAGRGGNRAKFLADLLESSSEKESMSRHVLVLVEGILSAIMTGSSDVRNREMSKLLRLMYQDFRARDKGKKPPREVSRIFGRILAAELVSTLAGPTVLSYSKEIMNTMLQGLDLDGPVGRAPVPNDLISSLSDTFTEFSLTEVFQFIINAKVKTIPGNLFVDPLTVMLTELTTKKADQTTRRLSVSAAQAPSNFGPDALAVIQKKEDMLVDIIVRQVLDRPEILTSVADILVEYLSADGKEIAPFLTSLGVESHNQESAKKEIVENILRHVVFARLGAGYLLSCITKQLTIEERKISEKQQYIELQGRDLPVMLNRRLVPDIVVISEEAGDFLIREKKKPEKQTPENLVMQGLKSSGMMPESESSSEKNAQPNAKKMKRAKFLRKVAGADVSGVSNLEVFGIHLLETTLNGFQLERSLSNELKTVCAEIAIEMLANLPDRVTTVDWVKIVKQALIAVEAPAEDGDKPTDSFASFDLIENIEEKVKERSHEYMRNLKNRLASIIFKQVHSLDVSDRVSLFVQLVLQPQLPIVDAVVSRINAAQALSEVAVVLFVEAFRDNKEVDSSFLNFNPRNKKRSKKKAPLIQMASVRDKFSDYFNSHFENHLKEWLDVWKKQEGEGSGGLVERLLSVAVASIPDGSLLIHARKMVGQFMMERVFPELTSKLMDGCGADSLEQVWKLFKGTFEGTPLQGILELLDTAKDKLVGQVFYKKLVTEFFNTVGEAIIQNPGYRESVFSSICETRGKDLITILLRVIREQLRQVDVSDTLAKIAMKVVQSVLPFEQLKMIESSLRAMITRDSSQSEPSQGIIGVFIEIALSRFVDQRQILEKCSSFFSTALGNEMLGSGGFPTPVRDALMMKFRTMVHNPLRLRLARCLTDVLTDPSSFVPDPECQTPRVGELPDEPVLPGIGDPLSATWGSGVGDGLAADPLSSLIQSAMQNAVQQSPAVRQAMGYLDTPIIKGSPEPPTSSSKKEDFSPPKITKMPISHILESVHRLWDSDKDKVLPVLTVLSEQWLSLMMEYYDTLRDAELDIDDDGNPKEPDKLEVFQKNLVLFFGRKRLKEALSECLDNTSILFDSMKALMKSPKEAMAVGRDINQMIEWILLSVVDRVKLPSFAYSWGHTIVEKSSTKYRLFMDIVRPFTELLIDIEESGIDPPGIELDELESVDEDTFAAIWRSSQISFMESFAKENSPIISSSVITTASEIVCQYSELLSTTFYPWMSDLAKRWSIGDTTIEEIEMGKSLSKNTVNCFAQCLAGIDDLGALLAELPLFTQGTPRQYFENVVAAVVYSFDASEFNTCILKNEVIDTVQKILQLISDYEGEPTGVATPKKKKEVEEESPAGEETEGNQTIENTEEDEPQRKEKVGMKLSADQTESFVTAFNALLGTFCAFLRTRFSPAGKEEGWAHLYRANLLDPIFSNMEASQRVFDMFIAQVDFDDPAIVNEFMWQFLRSVGPGLQKEKFTKVKGKDVLNDFSSAVQKKLVAMSAFGTLYTDLIVEIMGIGDSVRNDTQDSQKYLYKEILKDDKSAEAPFYVSNTILCELFEDFTKEPENKGKLGSRVLRDDEGNLLSRIPSKLVPASSDTYGLPLIDVIPTLGEWMSTITTRSYQEAIEEMEEDFILTPALQQTFQLLIAFLRKILEEEFEEVLNRREAVFVAQSALMTCVKRVPSPPLFKMRQELRKRRIEFIEGISVHYQEALRKCLTTHKNICTAVQTAAQLLMKSENSRLHFLRERGVRYVNKPAEAAKIVEALVHNLSLGFKKPYLDPSNPQPVDTLSFGASADSSPLMGIWFGMISASRADWILQEFIDSVALPEITGFKNEMSIQAKTEEQGDTDNAQFSGYGCLPLATIATDAFVANIAPDLFPKVRDVLIEAKDDVQKSNKYKWTGIEGIYGMLGRALDDIVVAGTRDMLYKKVSRVLVSDQQACLSMLQYAMVDLKHVMKKTAFGPTIRWISNIVKNTPAQIKSRLRAQLFVSLLLSDLKDKEKAMGLGQYVATSGTQLREEIKESWRKTFSLDSPPNSLPSDHKKTLLRRTLQIFSLPQAWLRRLTMWCTNDAFATVTGVASFDSSASSPLIQGFVTAQIRPRCEAMKSVQEDGYVCEEEGGEPDFEVIDGTFVRFSAMRNILRERKEFQNLAKQMISPSLRFCRQAPSVLKDFIGDIKIARWDAEHFLNNLIEQLQGSPLGVLISSQVQSKLVNFLSAVVCEKAPMLVFEALMDGLIANEHAIGDIVQALLRDQSHGSGLSHSLKVMTTELVDRISSKQILDMGRKIVLGLVESAFPLRILRLTFEVLEEVGTIAKQKAIAAADASSSGGCLSCFKSCCGCCKKQDLNADEIRKAADATKGAVTAAQRLLSDSDPLGRRIKEISKFLAGTFGTPDLAKHLDNCIDKVAAAIPREEGFAKIQRLFRNVSVDVLEQMENKAYLWLDQQIPEKLVDRPTRQILVKAVDAAFSASSLDMLSGLISIAAPEKLQKIGKSLLKVMFAELKASPGSILILLASNLSLRMSLKDATTNFGNPNAPNYDLGSIQKKIGIVQHDTAKLLAGTRFIRAAITYMLHEMFDAAPRLSEVTGGVTALNRVCGIYDRVFSSQLAVFFESLPPLTRPAPGNVAKNLIALLLTPFIGYISDENKDKKLTTRDLFSSIVTLLGKAKRKTPPATSKIGQLLDQTVEDLVEGLPDVLEGWSFLVFATAIRNASAAKSKFLLSHANCSSLLAEIACDTLTPLFKHRNAVNGIGPDIEVASGNKDLAPWLQTGFSGEDSGKAVIDAISTSVFNFMLQSGAGDVQNTIRDVYSKILLRLCRVTPVLSTAVISDEQDLERREDFVEAMFAFYKDRVLDTAVELTALKAGDAQVLSEIVQNLFPSLFPSSGEENQGLVGKAPALFNTIVPAVRDAVHESIMIPVGRLIKRLPISRLEDSFAQLLGIIADTASRTGYLAPIAKVMLHKDIFLSRFLNNAVDSGIELMENMIWDELATDGGGFDFLFSLSSNLASTGNKDQLRQSMTAIMSKLGKVDSLAEFVKNMLADMFSMYRPVVSMIGSSVQELVDNKTGVLKQEFVPLFDQLLEKALLQLTDSLKPMLQSLESVVTTEDKPMYKAISELQSQVLGLLEGVGFISAGSPLELAVKSMRAKTLSKEQMHAVSSRIVEAGHFIVREASKPETLRRVIVAVAQARLKAASSGGDTGIPKYIMLVNVVPQILSQLSSSSLKRLKKILIKPLLLDTVKPSRLFSSMGPVTPNSLKSLGTNLEWLLRWVGHNTYITLPPEKSNSAEWSPEAAHDLSLNVVVSTRLRSLAVGATRKFEDDPIASLLEPLLNKVLSVSSLLTRIKDHVDEWSTYSTVDGAIKIWSDAMETASVGESAMNNARDAQIMTDAVMEFLNEVIKLLSPKTKLIMTTIRKRHVAELALTILSHVLEIVEGNEDAEDADEEEEEDTAKRDEEEEEEEEEDDDDIGSEYSTSSAYSAVSKVAASTVIGFTGKEETFVDTDTGVPEPDKGEMDRMVESTVDCRHDIVETLMNSLVLDQLRSLEWKVISLLVTYPLRAVADDPRGAGQELQEQATASLQNSYILFDVLTAIHKDEYASLVVLDQLDNFSAVKQVMAGILKNLSKHKPHRYANARTELTIRVREQIAQFVSNLLELKPLQNLMKSGLHKGIEKILPAEIMTKIDPLINQVGDSLSTRLSEELNGKLAAMDDGINLNDISAACAKLLRPPIAANLLNSIDSFTNSLLFHIEWSNVFKSDKVIVEKTEDADADDEEVTLNSAMIEHVTGMIKEKLMQGVAANRSRMLGFVDGVSKRVKRNVRDQAGEVIKYAIEQAKETFERMVEMSGMSAIKGVNLKGVMSLFENSWKYQYQATVAEVMDLIRTKLNEPPIAEDKLKKIVQKTLNKRIIRHVKEIFGMTKGQIMLALSGSGFVLISMFAFIFLGVSAFMGGGTVKSVINTVLVAGAGLGNNLKGGKKEGEGGDQAGKPGAVDRFTALVSAQMKKIIEKADTESMMNREELTKTAIGQIMADPALGRLVSSMDSDEGAGAFTSPV